MTDPGWRPALQAVVTARADAGAQITRLERLSSGASRHTWVVDVESGEGPRRLVLQRRSPGGLAVTIGVETETALLRAAAAAGVPVPAVVASGRDDGLGAPWMLLEHVEGESIPSRILSQPELDEARQALVGQLGAAAAAVASIDPADLPELRLHNPIEVLRAVAEMAGEVPPAFEAAFAWLERRAPKLTGAPVVVHGDFRLGNLLVDESGLTAVLDWELAHLGHPLEDLGWLTVRAWRFGRPGAVAGLGDRHELWAAYEAAGGQPVDVVDAGWWEVHGTLRWGLISLLQSQRHLSGRERSLELAAIGRRVCETEWDLLLLLDPGHEPSLPHPVDTAEHPGSEWPHHAPSIVELVEEARHVLAEGELAGGAGGRSRYQARVVAHALGVVARELRQRDRDRLASLRAALDDLGVADEADLARRIAGGSVDPTSRDVLDVMWRLAGARLAVANPGWAERA